MGAPIRAIRGATTVEVDTPEAISLATAELVEAVLKDNALGVEEVISVMFTATPDLVSAVPATAARLGGLTSAALMCAQEIPVPGSLAMCIRLLMHAELDQPQSEVRHAYLRGAEVLRDDRRR